MKLQAWLALRGPGYICKRVTFLLKRYGITPAKAVARLEECIATLAEYGCAPTFSTPGCVVERYPHIIRRLQDVGAEIAVHGYHHVDLRAYPPHKASEQLVRAAQACARHGIEVHGFRCPYLSCTDDLMDALSKGTFDYSSNQAIEWDVVLSTDTDHATTIFDTLQRLYRPKSAHDTVCIPWIRSDLVEIPVCLPDDLQLHDGLQVGPEGMTQAWRLVLHRTHQRGELFVLGFHPELAEHCQQPFVALLREAAHLHPAVWIARLRDISDWWREKSGFAVVVSRTPAGLQISLTCSERATILARGLDAHGSERVWDGRYYRLGSRALQVPAEPRPFVGLPADAPKDVVSFLQEQGYVLDMDEAATRCGTYIDVATLASLTSKVELVNYIEASPGPLIRYWRWPDGAKSAMCVTGDLDALTLLDYGSRLFAR